MTLSLYVHWPYCLHKCPYCDFNVHLQKSLDDDAYVAALLQEMACYAAFIPPQKLCSVFFGGGTPSLMQPQHIAAILEQADRLFGLSEGAEITLEANPTSTENDKLIGFKQAGINRLSLGIQSLNDTDLQRLGRTHSAAEALQAVQLAHKHFANFSLDFIYARPWQTDTEWITELTAALSLDAAHYALYQLTIEPNTQFHTLQQTGRLDSLPDDSAADLYAATQAVMQAHRLPVYEISNHARQGYASVHNLNYWRGGDYMGIGAGAHGRLRLQHGSRVVTSGHRAPQKWVEWVQHNGHGSHTLHTLSDVQALEETLLFGLRLTDGIPLPEHSRINTTALNTLINEGYMQLDKNQLKTTDSGRLLVHSLVRAITS